MNQCFSCHFPLRCLHVLSIVLFPSLDFFFSISFTLLPIYREGVYMLLNAQYLLIARHTEKIKREHESVRLWTSKSWAAAAAAKTTKSITINRKSCLSCSSTIGTKRIHSLQHTFICAVTLTAHGNVNEKKNRMHHHRIQIDDLIW